jgi:hypothetical protein
MTLAWLLVFACFGVYVLLEAFLDDSEDNDDGV